MPDNTENADTKSVPLQFATSIPNIRNVPKRIPVDATRARIPHVIIISLSNPFFFISIAIPPFRLPAAVLSALFWRYYGITKIPLKGFLRKGFFKKMNFDGQFI